MRRVCITVLAAIAIAMTAAACSKDPQKAKVEYFESGNRYFDQKKYQEAVVEYRNAIQQDPKYGEARYKLAETYAKLDDARNAYREYIRAADLMPSNAEAQLRAGTLLLLAGQYEDARTRADKVLAPQPKHIEAQVLRANALAGLKNMEAAIEEINEAIALDPNKATTYANLGALEQVRGRAAEAEAAFKKAIEADPKSVIALLAYSNFLIATDRGQEAEASIKQALDHRAEEPAGQPRARRPLHGLEPARGGGAGAQDAGRGRRRQFAPPARRLLPRHEPAERRAAAARGDVEGNHAPGRSQGAHRRDPVLAGQEGRGQQDGRRGAGEAAEQRHAAPRQGAPAAGRSQHQRGGHQGEGGGHRRPALDWRALHARQPAGVARRGRRGDGLVP